MNDIFSQLETLKIIPVVTVDDINDALSLANALIAGGLPCAEIMFRSNIAEQVIRQMSTRKEMLLGGGTVLTVDQAKQAVEAGAKFIVSPGFDPTVVKYCIDNHIPVIPGISTPTDIQSALAFELKVLKFFPAESFGGLKTLQAISAPYQMVRFIATGGINADNLKGYLDFPKVLACGGSWMVKPELIKAGKFKIISDLAREAVGLAGKSQVAR